MCCLRSWHVLSKHGKETDVGPERSPLCYSVQKSVLQGKALANFPSTLLFCSLGIAKHELFGVNYLKGLPFLQKKIGRYISIYSRETEHPVSGKKKREMSVLGDIHEYTPVNGNNKNREPCESLTTQPRALEFFYFAFTAICISK